ncbi:MAG: response regulator [Anaerolineales bacterium]|nr:response regulator [Anaerolineales bacterium]
MITQESFGYHVRSALANLYSRIDLQMSPLCELLFSHRTVDMRADALRALLLDTLDRLRPQAPGPDQSAQSTPYEVLRLRYIEGLTPRQVCAALNVSRASFYRQHRKALDALVAMLWPYYCPQCTADRGASRGDTESAVQEAVRLARDSTGQAVPIRPLVEGVVQTLKPLAVLRHVGIRWSISEAVTEVYGDASSLRQIMLSTLCETLLRMDGGDLELTVGLKRGQSTWCLRGLPAGVLASHDIESTASLMLARALLGVYGEKLWLSKDDNDSPLLCFTLPTTPSRRILVVDDTTADARLYGLYLGSRHYVLELARSQQELAERLESGLPDLIVLDVLMPGWDGWAILQQLKTRPETASIPVVICSVLSQPELALSLGAAAVLQKPVSEEAFVQVVDEMIA